jgi:hypothetical protein
VSALDGELSARWLWALPVLFLIGAGLDILLF